MNVLNRNRVRVSGEGKQGMLFAHGFGCNQAMWRYMEPEFRAGYRTVLFDHVGAGGSDPSSYDDLKYGSLIGYARDTVEICRELELESVIFVGHSVSSMIGMLATLAEPELFSGLVMIGPSPCYVNDGEYVGGFTRADIDDLLHFLDSNYLGWSQAMSKVIMGRPDNPGLAEELENSFCQTDPEIAKKFARVTFLSDNRSDLKSVATPTLILQCSEDPIAPLQVGEYVHRQIRGSELVVLSATGHCPNLSAPEETVTAMRGFLEKLKK